MTPFQVIWSPEALRQLAAIWIAAVNRTEVTHAQHRIVRALGSDPKGAGKELSEGLWKIHDPPLLAFYEINDTHKILRVSDVYIQ